MTPIAEDITFQVDKTLDNFIHEEFGELNAHQKHTLLTECMRLMKPSIGAVVDVLYAMRVQIDAASGRG